MGPDGFALNNARLTLQQVLGTPGSLPLKNTKLTFIGVDVSKVPTGQVGTFYATTMPGKSASGVTPMDKHGGLSTYCDAQGCSKWDGSKQPCHTAQGLGGIAGLSRNTVLNRVMTGPQLLGANEDDLKGFQACPEFDFFEANQWGLSITSHSCGYDATNQAFGNTQPGSAFACNWAGNAITAIAPPSGRDPGVLHGHVQLVPAAGAVGANPCTGRGGRNQYYGHDCYIDSSKPFDVTVEIRSATSSSGSPTFTATVTQGEHSITATQTTNPMMEANFALPWTLIGSHWGGDTAWLDDESVPSPATDRCDSTYLNEYKGKGACTFNGDCNTPSGTTDYCNGLGPNCHDGGASCCKTCTGNWCPKGTPCVIVPGAAVTLKEISAEPLAASVLGGCSE
jgi:hypothetical protein